MKTFPQRKTAGTLALLALAALVGPTTASAQSDRAQPPSESSAGTEVSPAPEPKEVDRVIAAWPERPRLGAQMMLSTYGAPQEVTGEQLVWHQPGRFKRIIVTREEHPHDFPLPHTDFMEHTVHYYVPANRVEDLTKFDASCTYDRTRGELSARCDLERHNILTLNLAHDIMTGRMNALEARKAFARFVVDDMVGKQPPYLEALQFPQTTATNFTDYPVIPGAPLRPESAWNRTAPKGSLADGEILGSVISMNLDARVGALVVSKKKVHPRVADYARRLHQEQGRNAEAMMKLGAKIDVTPLVTVAVDQVRAKTAGALAAVVPLDGEEFSRAFLEAMVKGQLAVLEQMDREFLPNARNEDLRQHLAVMRKQVAAHIEMAQGLQRGSLDVVAEPVSDQTRDFVRDKIRSDN